MNIKKIIARTLETLAISTSILILNIIVCPEDPGFIKLEITPYAMAAFFCSVFYSRKFGFLSLGLSTAGVVIYSFSSKTNFQIYSSTIFAIVISSTVGMTYLLGTVKERDKIRLTKIQEKFKQLTKDNYWLKKVSDAQLVISRELEERISGQQTTITSLHEQMIKMDSLNLEKSLETLVETITLFTGATAITIWVKSKDLKHLTPVANHHIDDRFEPPKQLNIEECIEGWVFKNNRKVSARMITSHETLKKLDRGYNIISAPITLNKKVWGVLNIADMPFEKYNPYTERLLSIIINLAEPALTRAVEYNKQISENETDIDTHFPLFSQMNANLKRYIESSKYEDARISLLIIEISNFQNLLEEYPASEIRKLFIQLADDILTATAGIASFYMYKEDNQMAVLLPGTDNDGASLLCIDILKIMSSSNWIIGNNEISFETVIGYSSLGDSAQDANGLLKHAELILEMQKI
ncbi:MAG: GAF domain-containing protein [Spirochaetales bacterium]|nr:GAF domain-containing protein [Spirochaetales bacterium]